MKRTERHHLKENELDRLARQVRETVDARRREVTATVVALVIVAAVGVGYYAWRNSVRGHAQRMLAEAMAVEDASVAPPPPPGASPAPQSAGAYPSARARTEAALAKFRTAADAYPGTDAGIFARYQQASALVALGRPQEAIAQYNEVIRQAGGGIYGQMARLGVAEAQALAGQYDQAIAALKDLAQRKDGPLPIDGILMQLGRTYLDAGKRADAQQTFNRLVEQFPESPYSAEARRELDELKKT
jgi:tetratricopeptide (TPR) repeat protein